MGNLHLGDVLSYINFRIFRPGYSNFIHRIDQALVVSYKQLGDIKRYLNRVAVLSMIHTYIGRYWDLGVSLS